METEDENRMNQGKEDMGLVLELLEEQREQILCLRSDVAHLQGFIEGVVEGLGESLGVKK